MPVPIVLGLGVGIIAKKVAAYGAASTVIKTVKKKNDSSTSSSAASKMDSLKERHEANISKYNSANERTHKILKKIVDKENEAYNMIKEYADIIEKIHNRPVIKNVSISDVELPEADIKEISDFKYDIGKLIRGIKIANITSFALLPSIFTNPLTVIPALIFGETVSTKIADKLLMSKVDEAEKQMKEAEKSIKSAVAKLNKIILYSEEFYSSLCKICKELDNHLEKCIEIIKTKGNNFLDYSDDNQLIIENASILSRLTYSFLKTPILSVQKEQSAVLNTEGILQLKKDSDIVLEKIA